MATKFKVTYLVSGYVNKYATKTFNTKEEARAFRDKQAVKGFPIIPVTVRAKQLKKPSLSFSQRLQKSVKKHQRRQDESMALYRREQDRQGLKPDQPISLMDMVKGMEKRKKK